MLCFSWQWEFWWKRAGSGGDREGRPDSQVLPVSLNSVIHASHFGLNGSDTKWRRVSSLQPSAPVSAAVEDSNRTLFRQYSDKVRRFSLEHRHSAAAARPSFISLPTVRRSGRRAAAEPPERQNPARFGPSLHRRVTGHRVTCTTLTLCSVFTQVTWSLAASAPTPAAAWWPSWTYPPPELPTTCLTFNPCLWMSVP